MCALVVVCVCACVRVSTKKVKPKGDEGRAPLAGWPAGGGWVGGVRARGAGGEEATPRTVLMMVCFQPDTDTRFGLPRWWFAQRRTQPCAAAAAAAAPKDNKRAGEQATSQPKPRKQAATTLAGSCWWCGAGTRVLQGERGGIRERGGARDPRSPWATAAAAAADEAQGVSAAPSPKGRKSGARLRDKVNLPYFPNWILVTAANPVRRRFLWHWTGWACWLAQVMHQANLMSSLSNPRRELLMAPPPPPPPLA